MPIFVLINLLNLSLPLRCGYGFCANVYKSVTNKNTTLLLNGAALITLGTATLINGELVALLATAFIILGFNQITDAIAQTIQEHHTNATQALPGALLAYAHFNQYSMPIIHAIGYSLLAFATGASLLALPTCFAAIAGAFFGIRGKKTHALLSFTLSTLLATMLVMLPAYFDLRFLIGYMLYSGGNLIRFAEHKKTRLG